MPDITQAARRDKEGGAVSVRKARIVRNLTINRAYRWRINLGADIEPSFGPGSLWVVPELKMGRIRH